MSTTHVPPEWRTHAELTDYRETPSYDDTVAFARRLAHASSSIEYEGFGLPVLEAMQCGAPVITSHDPAVTEVSGGAAIHTTPDRLAETMEAILTNQAERHRRRELSLRRAADFSWAKTAVQTRAVYIEAIRRFHA